MSHFTDPSTPEGKRYQTTLRKREKEKREKEARQYLRTGSTRTSQTDEPSASVQQRDLALYLSQTQGGEYEHHLANMRGGDVDIADVAKRLGGKVVGPNAILCPNYEVRYYGPGRVHVYGGSGSDARAYAEVSEKLDDILPPRKSNEERTALALPLWHASTSILGSRAERYLRGRGITIPLPDFSLRYHDTLKHQNGGIFDGMVGLVVDVNNKPIAVHRTFRTDREPRKTSLGPIGGGAVRLSNDLDGLMIGEGIETCLSAMELLQQPAWSALNAGNMARLILPDAVRRVTILIDQDETGTGERDAATASARWQREGRHVQFARPGTFKDFNDLLVYRSRK